MAAVAEEESETQRCSNCKKDIPVANFTIHEIHCSRNIGVCCFCQEPIPKSEMKNHMELEHTQITCKCSMKMERGDLLEHETSACPLRPVACQHCDLELAFHKLQDHMDYCGTRTEQCSRCSRNVMLKDLKAHPEDCGQKAEESRLNQPKPCLNSEASLRNVQMIRNVLRSDGSLGAPLRANRVPESRLYNFLSGQQLPRNHPGRNGDLLLPEENQSDGITRELGPLEKTANTLAFGSREPDCHLDHLLALSLQQDNFPQDPGAAELQREFWKNICLARTCPTGNALEAKDFRGFSEHLLGSGNSSNNSKVATLLPCEFCEELYPEEDLILHQTGCSPANALASFSKRSIFLPQPEQEERLTDLWDQLQRNRAGGRGMCPMQPDSAGSITIPCEFCGAQLKEELLFPHQDRCDLRPTMGRLLSQPEPPAMGNLAKTESPDLSKRRIHHQGDLSPQYLEEFKKQSPSQPVRGSSSRGHPAAARHAQLNSPNNRREAAIGGVSERGKVKGQGAGSIQGERAQQEGQSDRVAEVPAPVPARRPPHNFPSSGYVPSFPVVVPTQPRPRNEGGTRPLRPAQYSRSTAKPWQTESAYPDEE